jgi:hypothetical protein
VERKEPTLMRPYCSETNQEPAEMIGRLPIFTIFLDVYPMNGISKTPLVFREIPPDAEIGACEGAEKAQIC